MSKQNTGRKFFATAATAALVASAIVPVASAAEFTDADKIASWATEAVEALAANEVISGNPDGSFNPAGTVTRAEAAKMFTVALGLDTKGTETFADVKDGQWFQEYVVAVVNAGIVNGMTTTEFAPNGKLTREQAAKMIVEAYGLEGEADLSAFADAKSVAGKWSEGYLATAVENGIIAGKGDKLAATDSISRQEFAVMLNRAINVETVDTAAVLAEAVKALETATAALTTEVAIEKIAEAKATVATANEAITAVEEAAKAAELTEEEAKEVATKVEAAKKAVETTEAAIAKAEEAAKVLAVESVTAINATQVEVKFNKAVKKSTVISGTNTLSNVVFTSLENPTSEITEANTTAELSEDGKTLTITAGTVSSTQEVFKGRYQVVINNIEDTTSVKADKYDEVINLGEDKVAPTITSTEKVDAKTLKVTISEPVANLGNISFKLEDGTVVPVVATGDGAYVSALSTDKKSFTVKIVGAAYIGKTVTATVIGAQDAAGNLLNPNPETFTIQVGDKDGVAPTVTSVSPINDKQVEVIFSEEVQGFDGTQLTISGAGIVSTFPTVSSVKQDETNKNKYVVTYASSILASGVTTTAADAQVAVASVLDLSGEAMTKVYKQIVTIKKDTEAPTLVSSSVITEAGVKYLVLNFNEALNAAPTVASASSVKDYVTTTGTFALGTATLSTDAKTVKVALEAKTGITGSSFASTALVEGTEYTVKFNAVDTSANATNTPVTAKFTYAATASSDKPQVVTTSALTGQTTVAITFDREVEGASATNPENYTINGVTVKSATLASVSGGTQVVTLTLDTNALTGKRAISVSNVKSKAGVAMDAFNGQVTLTENVKPEVKSAKVTSTTTIEVTFSEAVQVSTLLDNDDFKLFIGSTEITAGTDFTVASTGTTSETAIITLTDALTTKSLAETIKLETLVGATSPILDAVSNKINVGTVTVSK